MMLSALLLMLILPMTVSAAVTFNHWSSGGPFKTGLGNRVITALAVSGDNKTVYSGSGSGSVFSYAYTPPTVTTGAASGLSATGATLNGTVNANHADATVSFEYGPDTNYGTIVAATPATVTGTSDTAVSAPLTGLTPGTIYHYRVTATNSGGTSNGTDRTFATWLAPAFSSALATSFTYNSVGSFSVTASGIPAPAFTTSSTLPAGVTLNSNGTLSGTPAQTGTFPLTITAANSAGTANQSFILTVNKATPTATLAVGNSPLVYSGSPQAASVTISASSVPGAVANIITGGSADKTAAGSYAVTADFMPSDSANYNSLTGLSAGTLTIGKATATVTLGSLSQTCDGTAKSATATTTPSGKTVVFTYNGSATAPTNAGSYAVVATINDSNYQGTASGTLIVGKGTATVTLGSLSQTYDGTVKSATATTAPSGKTVTFTYNGSATAPTNAGTYAVVATISDSNYQGSASGTLIIGKAIPVITWNTPAAITAGSALSTSQLNASANVAGTFSYTPAAGTILSAGSATVAVTFTPGDTTNYTGASASVTLTVNAAPVIADTAPPTIDAFTIPASFGSLTVAITSFTASDATGVTGYLVSENAGQPAADAVWSVSAPTEYTFANQGTKSLYAFAKDAAGNVSVPLSASVTITMSDTTAPTVTSFTIPASANSLTVAVTTLEATDASGVSAWLLGESATATAGDSRWSTTKPADHTFTSQGTKTLYAFAKDAAGNVSAPLSATILITLRDTTAPTIDAVSIPATASSLTVAIGSISASDAGGVTGYFISESATPPAAAAAGWSDNAPSSYTFASQGAKTLYIFAKDAAGNVSLPVTASVTITLSDITAPSVTSFTLPAASASLTVAVGSFTAIDDTAVTGYLLSETNTATADSGNWTATPTSSYTFATAGAKILYAFARDAAGNISTPVTASVTITLPDVSAPSVSGFSVTGSGASLIVTVTNFTAIDDTAVTGYLVSESATAPAAADSGWTSTPPASYTFATGGSKTLYAFAKDAAGNVSTSATTTVTVSSVLRNGNGGSGPDPTIADALKAMRAYLGLVTLSSDDQIRYDVAPLSSNGVPEGNGIVDFSDAILILRRTIGIGNW
jgi:hypothetical protein